MNAEPYDVAGHVGDLSALTTEEVMEVRSTARVAIATIEAQLKDHARRPPGREDDSPAWNEYRSWRRNARWAVVWQRKAFEAAKRELTRRKDTGAIGIRRERERRAAEDPEGAARRAAQLEEQRARLRATLDEHGPKLLLLRAYRVIRHLLTDGEPLPSTLDGADRDALAQLALYLRDEYGKVNIQAFCAREGGAPTEEGRRPSPG